MSRKRSRRVIETSDSEDEDDTRLSSDGEPRANALKAANSVSGMDEKIRKKTSLSDNSKSSSIGSAIPKKTSEESSPPPSSSLLTNLRSKPPPASSKQFNRGRRSPKPYQNQPMRNGQGPPRHSNHLANNIAKPRPNQAAPRAEVRVPEHSDPMRKSLEDPKVHTVEDAALQREIQGVMQRISGVCKTEILTSGVFALIPPASRQDIDLNGSFVSNPLFPDNDFFDTDEKGETVIKPVPPMFPEDFKERASGDHPLSWWGVSSASEGDGKYKEHRQPRRRKTG